MLDASTDTPAFQTVFERRVAREAFSAMKRVGERGGEDAVTTQALLEPSEQAKVGRKGEAARRAHTGEPRISK